MGLVHWGAPPELVAMLRDAFSLKTFIETGTYRGDTAIWGAGQFERVFTVEGSEQVFAFASSRLAPLTNVKPLLGDSRSVLPKILAELQEPAMLWLDAHFCCGGPTYGGQGQECPLLEEIRVVQSSSRQHFVLIDDARLFLAPPPLPHRADQWPTIEQVLAAIHAGPHRFHVVIFEDVIVATPLAAKEMITRYCQQRAK